MTPGLHTIPEADYHADTASLSASGAKVLLGKRPPSEDSDAVQFGSSETTPCQTSAGTPRGRDCQTCRRARSRKSRERAA